VRTFSTREKRNAGRKTSGVIPASNVFNPTARDCSSQIRQILRPQSFQSKLKIGEPNDKYEQEADRVAEEVMRMPEPGCPECDEELVQEKPLDEQSSLLIQRDESEEGAGVEGSENIAPFAIEEWDDVERDFSVYAITVLVREQVTQNPKIRDWFNSELAKRGQSLEDLFGGAISVPVIIMDQSTNIAGYGQVRWNGVFLSQWTGKRGGKKTTQPDQTIALPDQIFTDEFFATRSGDMKEAASWFIHELAHWVDAYADNRGTPKPENFTDFGYYIMSLVDESIYDAVLKEQKELLKME
jgi:hypothetical protein